MEKQEANTEAKSADTRPAAVPDPRIPIDDAPPDPDQFTIHRRIIVEALQPEIPPQSVTLASNLREDIEPELYRRRVCAGGVLGWKGPG